MTRHRILMLLAASLCTVLTSVSGIAEASETIVNNAEILYIGKFSAANPGDKIPSGWEPLTFEKIKKHTDYRLIEDNGATVVQAKSDASASGLIRKIRIDPRKYPIIEWRWKATNIYKKGDVTQKSGDDYPARIYIAFEYDPEKVGFFERAKFGGIKMFYGEYPPHRRDKLYLGQSCAGRENRAQRIHGQGADDRGGKRQNEGRGLGF